MISQVLSLVSLVKQVVIFLSFFFFGGNLSIKVFSLLDCGPSLGQSCKIVKNHPWASHLSKFRFLSPVCILWFPI